MDRLFQLLETPDRNKTQMAYAANYLPRNMLNEGTKQLISWARNSVLFKHQVESALNVEMTELTYTASKGPQQWKIHWLYNNIPTEIEWIKKSDNFLIYCDFRVIATGERIVILSFTCPVVLHQGN